MRLEFDVFNPCRRDPSPSPLDGSHVYVEAPYVLDTAGERARD
jgi:hypothetical protein